jgi:hypothetical protein
VRTDRCLAEGRPGQRERERERRVSDADASYNASSLSTRTLNNAIPQRNHAKNNSLSEATRSLSQGPRQKRLAAGHRDRPKTRPYVRRTLDEYEHVATIYPRDASCQVVCSERACREPTSGE